MDLSHLKNKTEGVTAGSTTSPAAIAAADKPATAPTTKQKEPEKKYQHYSSSRISMRMISTKGRLINFTNFGFATDDQEVIDYLDNEIKLGLKDITKGALITEEEADPMYAFKQQVIAEHEAKKAAEAAGELQNFGGTPGAVDLNVSTTNDSPS